MEICRPDEVMDPLCQSEMEICRPDEVMDPLCQSEMEICRPGRGHGSFVSVRDGNL